ncbi:MAG: hypothetical protein GY946_15030, partial [bacterium]|nr:hypothetical protein [bacterium]
MPNAPAPASVRRPALIWGLWAVWVVLLLTLVLGDNPFTDGIALREAQGKRLRPTDYATTYFWWMALVNVIALPVVLTTWRLWQGPAEVPDFPRFGASEPRPPRWLIAGVLLAMASLAFTAAPRMTYSLWEDEKYMVVRTI